MEINKMNSIKLNNGIEMPQIGMGTFLIPQEEISRTIGRAYELGYRQFDTAWRYRNEGAIAQALKDNGIKREDVFITTKVNADALYFFRYWYGKHRIFNVRNFKSIRRAVEESFEHLGTDYIDLFLVHWPWPMFLKMYEVLTEFYKEGRIRAIGVCSFLPPHLEALKTVSDVVPAVNQFEISPLNTQKQLIKYCQERGIAVEAMSTFSHFRSNTPRTEITQNPVIKEIADVKGKSIVQVILRWLYQQEIILIPKTWIDEHLQENINILDFELTPEEMATIDSLDQGKFLNYNPYSILSTLPKKFNTWKGFNNELK
jgi:diketogulonate reductase-like aldo/keto reductase